MHNVVFDAVIFGRALINPHGSWGRLVFEHEASYRLILSRPIVEEILEIIQRPRLTQKYRGLATLNMEAIFSLLADAEIVELGTVPPISRDPKDDKFLMTAVVAGATYLVSEDMDLLVLETYQGIQIVTAATFLRLLDHGATGND